MAWVQDQNLKKNYHDLLISHLEKIQNLSASDFSGGFFKERTLAIGGVEQRDEVWVPDQFKQYVNCIINLYFFLKKRFADKDKKIENLYNDIKEDYKHLYQTENNDSIGSNIKPKEIYLIKIELLEKIHELYFEINSYLCNVGYFEGIGDLSAVADFRSKPKKSDDEAMDLEDEDYEDEETIGE